MQSFTCPECGHESTFDPWTESAHCPKCGYVPSARKRAPAPRPGKAGGRGRAQRPRERRAPHQRFLDELLSHWNGTHIPDRSLQLATPERAQAFFEDYRLALGEDPQMRPSAGQRFVRSHPPDQKAVLWFVGAYLMLKRGDQAKAAQHLHDLTKLYPKFPDAWVWLTATTADPARRVDYLENAVLLEPAHPLARDALAVAVGRVPATDGPQRRDGATQARVIKCPRCAGVLHYEPGAKEVACQYCGHRLALEEVDLLDGEATLVGDLQLQRRFEGQTWAQVQNILHCEACGAELTMTRRITKRCIFCGSTSVLVEDSQHVFVQPDGFLPFQLDEQTAEAAIEKAQHSAGQRLKTWWIGEERQVRDLQPVYLPFWVFDGFVEVRSPVASRPGSVDPAAHGLRPEGPKSRRDLLMFDNLLFSGMDFPPPTLLGRMLPFELEAMVPYEPRLLADWPAALYRRDVEEVVEDAYDAMLGMAVWRAGVKSLLSSADHAQLRRTYQVTSATYQLVLLPVWVALAQRENRYRLVLVNGQTGKVVFSAPVRRAVTG